jgi:hypothetical protein
MIRLLESGRASLDVGGRLGARGEVSIYLGTAQYMGQTYSILTFGLCEPLAPLQNLVL